MSLLKEGYRRFLYLYAWPRDVLPAAAGVPADLSGDSFVIPSRYYEP